MSETKNIKKMKAVRLHAIGDLRCDEMEVPVPKGEELLIKVGACGVCGSDYPRTYEHGTSSGIYPLTIGHEFAGEVVAAGSKENEALIGTKAAIYPLIPCRKCDPCETMLCVSIMIIWDPEETVDLQNIVCFRPNGS